MLKRIKIANYKSAFRTTVPLTPFTVLIGENGAGKSNVLEALVLAAAAGSNKLDTEYLSARGVRLCSSRLTKSAFDSSTKTKPITIEVETFFPGEDGRPATYTFVLNVDDKATPPWSLNPESSLPPLSADAAKASWSTLKGSERDEALQELQRFIDFLNKSPAPTPQAEKSPRRAKKDKVVAEIKLSNKLVTSLVGSWIGHTTFAGFTVYNPTYEVLRNGLAVPPTSPLGPRGEGLLATLTRMHEDEPDRFSSITSSLELFGWYKTISVPSRADGTDPLAPHINVSDRYIRARGVRLDENAVNEGFLFVLFYLTLFCSSRTPSTFGIENIETALNPRLCEVLVRRLIALAKQYGKQAILTTHNPATLDALNLEDKAQSLVILRRSLDGHTVAEAFSKPTSDNTTPVRLSEAFLRGHIGALPKGI